MYFYYIFFYYSTKLVLSEKSSNSSRKRYLIQQTIRKSYKFYKHLNVLHKGTNKGTTSEAEERKVENMHICMCMCI